MKKEVPPRGKKKKKRVLLQNKTKIQIKPPAGTIQNGNKFTISCNHR